MLLTSSAFCPQKFVFSSAHNIQMGHYKLLLVVGLCRKYPYGALQNENSFKQRYEGGRYIQLNVRA